VEISLDSLMGQNTANNFRILFRGDFYIVTPRYYMVTDRWVIEKLEVNPGITDVAWADECIPSFGI
jgi:hypothetical protein